VSRCAVLMLLSSALGAGCFPAFDDTPWLVKSPRVLAVRGVPAEVEPTKTSTFSALIASPEGTISDEAVSWSLCLRPRTLAERNGVAPECLSTEGEDIQALESRQAQVPMDACERFGPNPPPQEDPNAPPLRPADPDLTGGYYLPVRALVAQESQPIFAFGFERLRCPLAGAPRDVFREFNQRYTLNMNPSIEALETADGQALDASTISPGSTVTLRVRWAEGSVESYAYYDSLAVTIVDRVEVLTVSWFASKGSFEAERSQGETSADNVWTAPSEAGPVHFWFVLRDSRGGIDWREATIELP
jgi:hypothetical protein